MEIVKMINLSICYYYQTTMTWRLLGCSHCNWSFDFFPFKYLLYSKYQKNAATCAQQPTTSEPSLHCSIIDKLFEKAVNILNQCIKKI